MSELTDLIKSNRNIEKQNEEIIRLLKILVGEKEISEPSSVMVQQVDDLLERTPQIGEVYFIDDGDIFLAYIKDGAFRIDNLTGSSKPSGFGVQKLVSSESIKQNRAVEASTVILGESVTGHLPQTLMICARQGAKNVYIPWSLMAELLDAPEKLQKILKLDFYKTHDDLIEKLFG